MLAALRLQMDRQKALISQLVSVSEPLPDVRDQIIAEQRAQIKDLQHELQSENEHPLGDNRDLAMPWTSYEEECVEDPEGQIERYAQSIDDSFERFARDY